MRKLTISALVMCAGAPAFAGHADQATFYDVPVLGEAGLVGLAIVTGLWGARKLAERRNK